MLLFDFSACLTSDAISQAWLQSPLHIEQTVPFSQLQSCYKLCENFCEVMLLESSLSDLQSF